MSVVHAACPAAWREQQDFATLVLLYALVLVGSCASSVQTRQFGSDGACFLQLCLGVGDRFPGVPCRVETMCQRLAGSLFLRLRCWLVLLLVVLITPLLPLFFSYRQPCASGRNALWAVRYFPQILESQTLKKISGCHRTHTKSWKNQKQQTTRFRESDLISQQKSRDDGSRMRSLDLDFLLLLAYHGLPARMVTIASIDDQGHGVA